MVQRRHHRHLYFMGDLVYEYDYTVLATEIRRISVASAVYGVRYKYMKVVAQTRSTR